MKIDIHNTKINIHFVKDELKSKIPILLLHGFTGSLEDWNFIDDNLSQEFTAIKIDLIGHGESDSPTKIEAYTFESQIEIINKIIQKLELEKVIILGYSMGGRLALSFSMQYPEKIIALVLESTSFGVEEENEKNERINSDKILAKQIRNSTIENFITDWLNIPLFKTLQNISAERVKELKQKKIKSNSSMGLANSLLSFSTGKMKNYFQLCSTFKKPVLLVSGDLDSKFKAISEKANRILPNSEISIVKNCGHNVHFENPQEFLKLVNKFLLNIRELQ
jgi:2-succinyl-6-hydroxy-2,4-cyclohexadiene-1-carboxylate synthase